MPLFNLTDLQSQLRRHQRLIGIDPGRKRIGIALSDVSLLVASPYGVFKRDKLANIAARVTTLAETEDAGGLVVGWPLEEDGHMGPAAQAARDWALALSEATDLPAAMWNERHSTSTMQDFLTEQAELRHKRRDAVIDRMAAAHILQSALNDLREQELPPAALPPEP